MNKGDIILIPFPFTDLSGKKLRPAVILINSQLDLTICFITTHIKWKEPTDIEIFPTSMNGIKQHSVIRVSKIATVDKSLSVGKLGVLSQSEITDLNNNLKLLLQLS